VIVVGVDAHMQTHTAAAINGLTARFLAEHTVPARAAGFERLLAWARELDDERVWAIEDVRNLSGGLERFLLAQGERVYRVPPKLMAGQRKSARQYGKSDRIDATVIARAVLREERLQPACLPDPAQQQIKLLCEQREHLLQQANCAQRRLRWLLHDLDPDLQPPGRTLHQRVVLERLSRRLARAPQSIQVRMCRELIIDIRALTRRCEQLHSELAPLVRSYAPALLGICGVATLTAAKLISEIDDVTRFQNDAQLAMYGGVAPLDASSGQQRRHRLNRTGNRQLNRALYLIAVTQVRVHTPARDYVTRRVAEGKSKKEAIRALKRYIARHIFRILLADAARTKHPPIATPTAPLGCLT
jgi:transposase